MAERSRAGTLMVAIVAAFVLLMAVTNPDRDDFATMLDSQVADDSSGFFDRVSGEVSNALEKKSLVVRNYVLFSVAETTVGDTTRTYVGAFRNWFPVGD